MRPDKAPWRPRRSGERQKLTLVSWKYPEGGQKGLFGEWRLQSPYSNSSQLLEVRSPLHPPPALGPSTVPSGLWASPAERLPDPSLPLSPLLASAPLMLGVAAPPYLGEASSVTEARELLNRRLSQRQTSRSIIWKGGKAEGLPQRDPRTLAGWGGETSSQEGAEQGLPACRKGFATPPPKPPSRGRENPHLVGAHGEEEAFCVHPEQPGLLAARVRQDSLGGEDEGLGGGYLPDSY